MQRRLLILFAPALLALALATPTLAIDGGRPDGDGHPNVGVLAFDVDGPGPTPPFAICTGSVISDHAFLTAAHCIEPPLVQLPPDVQWVVTLEPGSPTSPVVPGGYFPADYPACCVLALPESQFERANGAVVDPDYVPGFVPGSGAPTLGPHDLAVVLFPAGTFASVRPVDLPRPGQLDHLAAAGDRRGPQFTLTAYGGEVRSGGLYLAGYRKTARATFHDLAGNWLQLDSAAGEQPHSGGLCTGDSGSPQFLGDTNTQVSLLHESSPGCNGTSYAQRLDTPAEQAFLAPYRSPHNP
jgi:hypothetical protein